MIFMQAFRYVDVSENFSVRKSDTDQFFFCVLISERCVDWYVQITEVNWVEKWVATEEILMSSSSLSCCTISTDNPDPLPPAFSIIHHFRQVLKVTSCISTELLYVGSSWSSCLCLSMWRGPQDYITYEFIPTSPAVSRMSDINVDVLNLRSSQICHPFVSLSEWCNEVNCKSAVSEYWTQ